MIFISVDAKRDTPQQLAKYVPYFDPEFIGVTAADQPTIEAVAHKLGVRVSLMPPPGRRLYGRSFRRDFRARPRRQVDRDL